MAKIWHFKGERVDVDGHWSHKSENICSAASRFWIRNMFGIYRAITEPYRTNTEPFACIIDGYVYTEPLQNHWLAALYSGEGEVVVLVGYQSCY